MNADFGLPEAHRIRRHAIDTAAITSARRPEVCIQISDAPTVAGCPKDVYKSRTLNLRRERPGHPAM
jgi:hypothetical protein